MTGYFDAKAEIKNLIDDLENISDSAARSLTDGLEETLTLHRLGVRPTLRLALRSTSLIESCFSSNRRSRRDVKNW